MGKHLSSAEWFNGVTLEGQVLIRCSHPDLSATKIQSWQQLLAKPIHWELFKKLAKKHGLIPLVSQAFRQLPTNSVPQDMLDGFAKYTQANSVLKHLILKEMLTISEAFSHEGIDVVPFKGPILALSIYDCLELREFMDLDLLVKPNQMDNARKILLTLGYSRRKNQEPAENTSPSLFYNFNKKNGLFLVDLQYGLRGSGYFFSLDHEIFWNNLEVLPIHNQKILNFSPEILLVLLCLHGHKHVWEHAKWICDLATLLHKKPDLDWARVVHLSSELHCLRQVLMGVCLAHQMFESSLPSTIQHQIENDKDIPLLSQGIPYSLIQVSGKQVHIKHEEAFFLSLKETNWELFQGALQLCRLNSCVIGDFIPWFRLQRWVKLLFALIHPLQSFYRKISSRQISK